jgi:hypothetical protein
LSNIEDEATTVWQRLSLKQLRWTAVAVVLVVTAAFGGLQTAHHVTPISFGQTYTAGAVRITPHSVSLADKWPGLPDMSQNIWETFNTPREQPGPCRYLVLNVTIQNTATESIPFPLEGVVVGGHAEDCAAKTTRNTEMFGITGVSNRYVTAFRGHESIMVPSIEPGFTNDYAVVWAVSRAELSRHPQITIRIYNMYQYVSTFRIARDWAGDADHYAELRIPERELS